jgi:hypothetical protein
MAFLVLYGWLLLVGIPQSAAMRRDHEPIRRSGPDYVWFGAPVMTGYVASLLQQSRCLPVTARTMT